MRVRMTLSLQTFQIRWGWVGLGVSVILVQEVPILAIGIDTAESLRRQALMNYPHEVVLGGVPSDQEVLLLLPRHAGRQKGDTLFGTVGAFVGHLRAWRLVAERGVSSIIVEDDAHLIRSFDAMCLPADGITLLGGTIRTLGAWSREREEFLESREFLRLLSSFGSGVNRVAGFRFTMCIAYHLPASCAARLVQLVDREGARIRAPDVFLFGSGLVTHLYFPNPFVEVGGPSQCNSPKSDLDSDFYVSSGMRRFASAQFGLNVNKGGTLDDFRASLGLAFDAKKKKRPFHPTQKFRCRCLKVRRRCCKS
jgi:hypothetical protein